MNILVDRHHSDLLYALQRLFEDRLGLRLYVPVGHEWWDEGYWQFGKCFRDDRLAQQYLVPNHPWEASPTEGVYTTFDPAHPSRAIYGVSLERARSMDWAFVMPSVQENQDGYARFARERGAMYLLNVGNTGQHIDWSLNPLVINNSEADIPESKGVTIHQEIDSEPGGAFEFLWPHRRNVVRSFVNAFDRLPGYQAFLDAEEEMGCGCKGGWVFCSHGHDGRNGDVVGVERIGNLMAGSGWAWHDKPVGDGFGHVIHSWAAVGRPLIGHARYYTARNCMAAPFWTPATSIDLDGHDLASALVLMREIAADPDRHNEMCYRIRKEFDGLVDYDEEAQMVRDLLGL